jgi:RNA ligase
MTVFLKDVLPVDLLLKHIEDGVVRKQVHPDYSDQLYILNYSEQAQFGRIWDAVTNVCRGLIVAAHPDGDYVIARGFNKFHNYNTEYIPETMDANLPNVTPVATQKLDGSMGLPYYWDGKWSVATRGSFASDQAKWATAWLRHNYPFFNNGPLSTPVCEVIYKENRIVVDYDFEGLVLLGFVDLATGYELGRLFCEDWAFAKQFPIVKKFEKTLAECAAENNLNEEGYVLTYDKGRDVAPLKIKVKFADYVRLHRILTGLNPKAIWEMLEAGQNEAIDTIIADPTMPTQFIEWFRGWVEQFRDRYREMERKAEAVFAARPEEAYVCSGPENFIRNLADDVEWKASRKAAALYFKKTPELCSILFAMLDGKNCASIIWDRLKPKATDTFKKDGE